MILPYQFSVQRFLGGQAQLVQRVQFGRQAAVDGEDLLVDDAADGQMEKEVLEQAIVN